MQPRQIAVLMAKILLFALLWWAIYRQLFGNISIWDLGLYNWQQLNNAYFWLALLLVGLNWSLEAFKWRSLLAYALVQSFAESLRAVLGGVALALFTPNRIGEYGGRVYWLPETVRWQGIIALLAGNMLQLSVNLIYGSIGFTAYCYIYRPFSAWIWAVGLGILLAVLMLLLFYALFLGSYLFYWQYLLAFFDKQKNKPYSQMLQKKIAVIVQAPHNTWFKNTSYALYLFVQNSLKQLRQALYNMNQHYSTAQLCKIWLWSAGRYMVYVCQYALLIKAFDLQSPFDGLLIAVTSAYFIQTILPTIAILELGIKGNIALFIFAALSINSTAILSATLLLWCFNLAIPALFGAILLFVAPKRI